MTTTPADEWTDARRLRGPFPYTARKVAESLSTGLAASQGSFLSATLDENGSAALVVDALDLEPGRYGRSFMVTVRDVDDPRPEDTFDNLRAFARSLADHPTNNPHAQQFAARMLSIMDGE